MKKIVVLFLCICLASTGCNSSREGKTMSTITISEPTNTITETKKGKINPGQNFNGLNDPKLLKYIENTVYGELESSLSNDDYNIEKVDAVFLSKEYLEELEYNSKTNIYFGYSLEKLNSIFEGTKYVFTLDEDGTTTVKAAELIADDTYEKVIKNVAIGTGVIFLCVTVSVVTAGVGAPAVSMIFTASAKTATTMAISSSIFGGVAAGTVEGIKTGDFEEAKKSALLAASEGFKWGAISGAIIGGASEANALRKASDSVDDIAKLMDEIDDVSSLNPITRGQIAEQKALSKYPGKTQISFLNGKQVPYSTAGSTRPDIIRTVGDHLEAIEVKSYDLSNNNNIRSLCTELKRQIYERIINLPEGSTQRILLDRQGFSDEICDEALKAVEEACKEVLPDIVVELL